MSSPKPRTSPAGVQTRRPPSLVAAILSVGLVGGLSICLSFPAAAQGTGGGTSGGAVAPPQSDSAPSSRPDPSVEPGRVAAGTGLSPQERQFVEKAAMGGLAEVELGRLAQERASSPQVREFGEVMERDHDEAYEELEQIADDRRIDVPEKLDAMHWQKREALAKLSGEAFDRAYIDQMLVDHRTAISDYERQSQQGQDIGLKSYAAKNLLILREHLKMAESIDRNLRDGRAGGGSGDSPRARLGGAPRGPQAGSR